MLTLWIIFGVLVITLLSLDLGVFNRRAHAIGFKESLKWCGFWISLAFLFNLFVYLKLGPTRGLEFTAGYLIEESLSVDNLFVFLVIFSYFKVPKEYLHRVLFWGILGAIILRVIFIVLGVALISRFHWVLYLFGAFLIFAGVKLLLHRDDIEIDPSKNIILRVAKKIMPVTHRYSGGSFFVRTKAGLMATPLFLVLLVIESTDVVFAVDSIPAVLGVTQDTFIVVSSNIFAIMGLRALFFVLASIMNRFTYLKMGLGFVLSFIGMKMVLTDIVHIPIGVSLSVVATLIGGSIIISLLAPPKGKVKSKK
jgi:tellurite resistance protein TerC